MEQLVPLELIDPNPYQPREHEDPEHIRKIADSIAAEGLMQTPVGRWVDALGKRPPHDETAEYSFQSCAANGWRVQLAFGHSRLAAFHLLHAMRPNGYARMPISIRGLTDEEMFRLGISENLARKNLTPIEEALAMIRYRDSFGKTSEEIGKLFGLSDSGVRNKMRLLKLPEDLKDLLRKGEIREGVARELISICELPDDVRLASEDQDEFIKPSHILEAAKSGSNQKAIAEMVSRCMGWIGEQLLEKPKPQPAPPPAPEPAPARKETPPWIDQAVVRETDTHKVETTHYVEPEPISDYAAQAASAPLPTLAPTETKKPDQPAAVDAPTPAPTPAATPTWGSSTITVTLTYWPEDGKEGGRTVMLGARANQNLPMMRMYREAALTLGDQLADLLETLKTQQFGGE